MVFLEIFFQFLSRVYVHMCLPMCICVHVCPTPVLPMCVCVHMCTHTCVCLCVYMCTCVPTPVFAYVCICAHVSHICGGLKLASGIFLICFSFNLLPYLLRVPRLWSSALVTKNHIHWTISPSSSSAEAYGHAAYLSPLSTWLTPASLSYFRVRGRERRKSWLWLVMVVSYAHPWPWRMLPRDEFSLRYTLNCEKGKIHSLDGCTPTQLK